MIHSPFSTLFLAIQKRLQEEVPELRFIEQDLGQLEEEVPPVSYPCALIDLTDWQYETAGENMQYAVGAIHIRVCMEAWSSTNSLTARKWKEKALAFYDLEWAIYKALQGWKPRHYGALIREAVSTEGREDNLRVRLMRFSCHFEDFRASPDYDKTPLPPPAFVEAAQEPPVALPFKVRVSGR